MRASPAKTGPDRKDSRAKKRQSHAWLTGHANGNGLEWQRIVSSSGGGARMSAAVDIGAQQTLVSRYT